MKDQSLKLAPPFLRASPNRSQFWIFFLFSTFSPSICPSLARVPYHVKFFLTAFFGSGRGASGAASEAPLEPRCLLSVRLVCGAPPCREDQECVESQVRGQGADKALPLSAPR